MLSHRLAVVEIRLKGTNIIRKDKTFGDIFSLYSTVLTLVLCYCGKILVEQQMFL